ncbi:hypothetical protein ES705_08759 [subsurface metagenome]
MIQRIQSAFLLAASILSIIFVFHPLSRMILAGGISATFYTYALNNSTVPYEAIYHTFPIVVLAVLTTLLNLIAIFIYKRRVLQMRICVYNILLTIGMIVLIFYYYFVFKSKLDVRTHAFSYSILFPFINVILIFQAFRGIRRDDLLLKSYNRLRDKK